MVKNKTFLFIGGDERQKFLSKSIEKDGNKCETYIDSYDNFDADMDYKIKKSDFIILPIPVTRDEKTLNAVFLKEKVHLNLEFIEKFKNKIVFCGGAEKLSKIKGFENIKNVKDYSLKEDFAVMNAVPTAQGAILLTMDETKETINGKNFLVFGFGRVGKALSYFLKNMDAKVTVVARKSEDLAWIKNMGYEAKNINKIDEISGYDMIFNTIPFKIFDKEMLLKCRCETKIMDLASLPGGVDMEFAKKRDIKVIQALGLPGKYFPKTAGEIIKKVIYDIIEEENL